MKIKTDEAPRLIAEQASKKPKIADQKTFDDLLRRSIEVASGKTAPSGALERTAGARLERVDGIDQTAAIVDEQHGPILQRVEHLLDTLEEYQRVLGTPNVSAESLHSVIGRMEEQNTSLAAVLVTLRNNDELKEILNRVLVASVVEVEKFKRGDYS